MKKLLLFSAIQTFLFFSVEAQVLNVNNTEQLYDQWCWAGISKTVLDYYGFFKQQCDIAEWVRTTATFHNFGSVNCCTNANQGCNYWNYNYGYAGSIQEILIHFGSLQNIGVANALTLTEITTEIQNNRLFVIRWGWSTGGGHFIVGHGISGNNIYFMNPWFGEGLHIGTYNFMLSGVDNTSTATHTWTHTNKITSIVSAVNEAGDEETISVYPNPFCSETTLQSDKVFKDATLTIYNLYGQTVKQIKNISGQTITLYRDNLPGGLYFINLTQGNKTFTDKLVIADY
jgi:hypothetical protein